MGYCWQPQSLDLIVKNNEAGTVQYVGVVDAFIFAADGTLTGYLSSFVSIEHCRIALLG